MDKCIYKDTSSAGRGWALAAKTLDLAVRLHLVILQDGHLDLLALVFDLFGGLSTWFDKPRVTMNVTEHTLYVFFLRFFAPPRKRRTR